MKYGHVVMLFYELQICKRDGPRKNMADDIDEIIQSSVKEWSAISDNHNVCYDYDEESKSVEDKIYYKQTPENFPRKNTCFLLWNKLTNMEFCMNNPHYLEENGPLCDKYMKVLIRNTVFRVCTLDHNGSIGIILVFHNVLSKYFNLGFFVDIDNNNDQILMCNDTSIVIQSKITNIVEFREIMKSHTIKMYFPKQDPCAQDEYITQKINHYFDNFPDLPIIRHILNINEDKVITIEI